MLVPLCLILLAALAAPLAAQGAVIVDAEGVLQNRVVEDDFDELMRRRDLALNPDLPGDVAAPSELRKVSLVKLEAAVRARLEAGEPLTDAMRYLAGVQRIDYVFLYPKTGDLVVAGPAEGWTETAVGRVVGWSSGRPPIHLDDLVQSLRAFPPSGRPRVVGCGISPTQDGLARLQKYLKRHRSLSSHRAVEKTVQGMREAIGYQSVSIYGVPATSRLGLVLVEADYRMKLMAIELDPPPFDDFETYLDLAIETGESSIRMLTTWALLPSYDAIRTTPDRNAYQLLGKRVRVVSGENRIEKSGATGESRDTDQAAGQYAEEFSELYPRIADAVPVFAELAACVDLLVLAALLQDRGVHEELGWESATFLDGEAFAVTVGHAPTKVESVVNYRWKSRNRVLTPVGGGVSIDAYGVLSRHPPTVEEDEALAAARVAARATSGGLEERVRVPAGDGEPSGGEPAGPAVPPRWWWD